MSAYGSNGVISTERGVRLRAAYTVKNNDQLAYASHREKGTCENGRKIRLPELERRVFAGVRQRLLAPEIITAAMTEYRDERKRLGAETVGGKRCWPRDGRRNRRLLLWPFQH